MEIKIINKNKDPLFSRTKIESEIIFDKSTPSREEIKNKLVSDLGIDGKLIVVKGIYTTRGLKKASNLSYVYENEETLKRVEVQKKKKDDKKEAKEEVKTPETKKEETAEEKPKELKEAKKDGQKPQEKKSQEKK